MRQGLSGVNYPESVQTYQGKCAFVCILVVGSGAFFDNKGNN
ncbi:hypothetical protein SALWKB12_0017 [Snodgrassella communis]|uniref:Uncharacterized protein n=1 Tax=Snodgrassella communis TaxID=2946699 RepID=A0A836MQ73_9NEIS|nr:hypothetical protein SALWKB12_0017 [Snodgrassella communis]KDN14400.1 hypothetical protein SALWKB29_1489 [Snodgrassella communis]